MEKLIECKQATIYGVKVSLDVRQKRVGNTRSSVEQSFDQEKEFPQVFNTAKIIKILLILQLQEIKIPCQEINKTKKTEREKNE